MRRREQLRLASRTLSDEIHEAKAPGRSVEHSAAGESLLRASWVFEPTPGLKAASPSGTKARS